MRECQLSRARASGTPDSGLGGEEAPALWEVGEVRRGQREGRGSQGQADRNFLGDQVPK